jgi:dihydrofolate reductase
MTFTTAHLTMSLDGFVAGADQTMETPLGIGGEEIHGWMGWDGREMHPADTASMAELQAQRGALLMGRNMFGPVRGPWETWTGDEWRGWWGDEPPYHAPVFVLTHHEREPVEMDGGTTFHFVTDGFAEGLRQAREAGDGDVRIAGGASVVRQSLEAGELDELILDIVPHTLGDGERLFPTGVGELGWEPTEVLASPYATHVRYQIPRP